MKTIIVLSILVIITTLHCSASVEDTANADDVPTRDRGDEFKAHTECCADSGGSVYTRWGRKACPDTEGTELLYKGLVVGTDHTKTGGGADWLCIATEGPEYLSNTVPKFSATDFTLSFLTGAKYQIPGFPHFGSILNHDAPCAVCYVSQRSTKLMIPGKTSCPTSWTEEYEGYLVSERSNHPNHKHTIRFECLDKDGESFAGLRHSRGALIDLVSTKANEGLPCPPYVPNRPITCVVCTK